MTRSWFAVVLSLVTALSLGPCLATNVAAQGSWEFLGPGVGYHAESLCVTDLAVYVGMAEENGTGLGLYRYRFADGQWDLFAFPGQRVTAVSVAGANDERIVVGRYDAEDVSSEVLRSADGGQSWTTVFSGWWYMLPRIRRAPSESTHLFVVEGMRSTDDGESWQLSEFPGEFMNNRYEAAFDPQNADIVYMTAEGGIETDNIYKSTDAGATFDMVGFATFCYGLDVDVADPTRILAAHYSHICTSTDAGASWTSGSCPLSGKMVAVASWAPGSFFVLGTRGSGNLYDVVRTSDQGATWDYCAPGLPSSPAGGPWGPRMYIEPHPTRPELYLALDGSGVWRFAYDPAAVPNTADGPHALQLSAFPNPATDGFRVDLQLPQTTSASLRLMDVQGRVVDTLLDGARPQGAGEIRWVRPAGGRVPAGVYYLRLDAGAAHASRVITLLR